MILTIDTFKLPSDDIKVQFKQPLIGFKTIKLKSVTLYNSFFNVTKTLPDKRAENYPSLYDIQIDEGFYNSANFIEAIYKELKYKKHADISKIKLFLDPATSKFTISNYTNYEIYIMNKHPFGFEDHFWIPKYIHFTISERVSPYPFNSFQIHCNILDTHDNYYNANPSDILDVLPVIESNEFASKHTYESESFSAKKVKSEIKEIDFKITDENGYVIDFHDYPILLKFELN